MLPVAGHFGPCLACGSVSTTSGKSTPTTLKTAILAAENSGMRMAVRALRRPKNRGVPHSTEAGLSLIEVMIAMVIFAVVAAALVAGLASVMKTARLDKNRVAAANLASRELEIVRNEFNASLTGPTTLAAANYVVNPHPLPGGTAGSPLLVDTVPYTVTRNVEWLPAGTGKSACDGGAAITYPTLSVNVEVSWPGMAGVPPVETSTVLTPRKGILSSSLAFVGVKVLDNAGLPQVGQLVQLSGPGGTTTDTTEADGCAVFSVSSFGTYAASMNTVGQVDFYGTQNPSKNVTVASGTLSQLTFNYDQAATLGVTLATQAGYALPTTLPGITMANTGLQPSGIRQLASSGVTTTIPTLWPFTDGYSLWAGTCSQSDPATAGGTRSPAVIVAPGASGASTVTLGPVSVHVQTTLGVALTNATVTAVPVSVTGCTGVDASLTLGVTNASGNLLTSLPAGSWQIKVTGRSPSPTWPTVSGVLPTSAPKAVTVVTT
jgi:prepilin-type N-terminal cleavage/methylation domain-containing protein